MGIWKRFCRSQIAGEVAAEISAKLKAEREAFDEKIATASEAVVKSKNNATAANDRALELAAKVREQSEADAVLASVKIIFAAARGAKDSDLGDLKASQFLAQQQMHAMAQMQNQIGKAQYAFGVAAGGSLMGLPGFWPR